MELVHSGKVRELYADGDDIIMVASDRVSVYDVVLPTPIPGKGQVLTQLSLWWFGQLSDVIPNHVISGTDVPEQWAGRAIRCRRLRMLPVECIARGYLAGLGLASYNETGTISGVRLPPGLGEGSRLPEPVFTPTTKAATGHDEPMKAADVAALVGEPVAAELEAGHPGGLPARRRAGRLARHRHRGHQGGVRPAPGRDADAGRRAAHAGLVPVLAGRGVAAGPSAALAGQAVPAGLVGRARLGPPAAGPGHPARRGGRDPGALPGALYADNRPVGDPAVVVRARRLRAARGVVVARDVALTAAPGNVVAVEGPERRLG